MRIAYLCYWGARRRDGVVDKILAQVAAWRRLGHDVALFVLEPHRSTGPSVLGDTVESFDGLVGRVAAGLRLERAIRLYAPDLVYVRYDLFLPPPIRLPCAPAWPSCRSRRLPTAG